MCDAFVIVEMYVLILEALQFSRMMLTTPQHIQIIEDKLLYYFQTQKLEEHLE